MFHLESRLVDSFSAAEHRIRGEIPRIAWRSSGFDSKLSNEFKFILIAILELAE